MLAVHYHNNNNNNNICPIIVCLSSLTSVSPRLCTRKMLFSGSFVCASHIPFSAGVGLVSKLPSSKLLASKLLMFLCLSSRFAYHWKKIKQVFVTLFSGVCYLF